MPALPARAVHQVVEITARTTLKYRSRPVLLSNGHLQAGSWFWLALCRGQREDLSGVHEALGIQRLLEGPHHRHGVLAVLVHQISLLSQTDPVLAGAGAPEAQRAGHQPRVQRLDLFDLA